MAQSQTIEIDAPAWDLLINGQQLPVDRRPLIRSIRVEATVDGADELTIEADAFNTETGKFVFIGEDLLAPGNEAIPLFGYGADLAALQRFFLVREEAHYPDSAPPTVTIRGYSAEYLLAENKRPRMYPGPIADSEIVKQLAADNGLTVTADSIQATESRKGGRTKEKGKSDLEFLQGLAAANGYGPPMVRYDSAKKADILYFRQQDLRKGQEFEATFVYDPFIAGSEMPCGSLLSFDPTINLAGVPTQIEIAGHDPVAQKDFVLVVEITENGQKDTLYTGAEIKQLQSAKSGSQQRKANTKGGKSSGHLREHVQQHKTTTIDEARVFAKLWIKTRNAAYMTARGRTVGWNGLWIQQIHRFTGLAPTHNGLWEVQQVTHTMEDGGYFCDVDLARVLTEAAEPKEGV